MSLAAAVALLNLTVPVDYQPGVVSHYDPALKRIIMDERLGRQPAAGSMGWYVLGHELFHHAQQARGDSGFDEDEADRFGKFFGPQLEQQANAAVRRRP